MFKLIKVVGPPWGDTYGTPDLHDMLTVREDGCVGRVFLMKRGDKVRLNELFLWSSGRERLKSSLGAVQILNLPLSGPRLKA